MSLSLNHSPDILALCETKLDDSIDSGNFSVRGYLPLIQKDSSTNMHGLAVYVKEGLPYAWDLSLENSADSYLCFRLALLHSVSYFFFLYRSPSSSLYTVFDSSPPAPVDVHISSNPSICSTMTFPPLGNSDHVIVSVSIYFPINSKHDAPFHRVAYDYSCTD